MPELLDRERFESEIVSDLQPVFRAEYARAIGSPRRIPIGQFARDLKQVMADSLAKVFQASGFVMIHQLGLVLTEGVFEDRARQWSGAHAQELADQVIDTSLEMADAAVSRAAGDAQKVREGLALIFLSDSRLQNIAITEVTSAASAGEHAIVIPYNLGLLRRPQSEDQSEERHRQKTREELSGEEEESAKEHGKAISGKGPGAMSWQAFAKGRSFRPHELIPIWQTSRMANVCDHCAPLEGHGPHFWAKYAPLGPPLHPRCNCHLKYVEAAEYARRAA